MQKTRAFKEQDDISQSFFEKMVTLFLKMIETVNIVLLFEDSFEKAFLKGFLPEYLKKDRPVSSFIVEL